MKKYFLRLLGIDTPETKHPKIEVQKYGIEAYNFSKILEGKDVILKFDSKNFIDTYGRFVGYVMVNNKNFNQILLENGLARIYTKYDFDLIKEFKISENIAKNNKVGIWFEENKIDFEKISLKEKEFDIEKLEKLNDEIKSELLDSKIVKVNELLNQSNENNNLNNYDKSKIKNILNSTFSQKIKKQKAGVKVYGQTLPKTKIIFEIVKKEISEEFSFLSKAYALDKSYFQTISDINGKYEIILNKVEIGEFDLKTYLKIDDKTSYLVDKINTFDIDEDYLEYINFSKQKKAQAKILDQDIKSIISLQKLAKNIDVLGNKIICKETDDCNINFDGRKSDGNKIEYFWDFGNGETSKKSNPSSIKFKTGKYIVSLKVSYLGKEDTSYYLVEVSGKPKKIKENKNESTVIANNFNVIPKVYAGNNTEKNDLNKHILLSSLIFLMFLLLSFLLLRKRNII